jgi:hypothetical protein
MDRVDQLIADYLDGELSAPDAAELARHLEQDPQLRGLFLDLCRQHGLMNAQGRTGAEAQFTAAVLAELRRDQEQFVGLVMCNLGEPVAGSARAPATGLVERARLEAERIVAGLTSRLRLNWLASPVGVALAACLALAFGLGGFLLLRTEPTRAWVWKTRGNVLVQRGNLVLPAATGLGLRAGDVLQTAASSSTELRLFGEPTALELDANAELWLTGGKQGKGLELRRGQMAATVAPQPPGRPLVVATPQARVKVLGTRFRLAARSASTWLEVAAGAVELTRRSDQRLLRVAAGQFAVAAAGVELASHPLQGPLKPDMPQPIKISFFSEYPEDEDWITTGDFIQRRGPSGPAFHPYKVPPITGSVLLEAVARVDGLGNVSVAAGGWGFGLGLRCEGQETPLSLRSIQQGPQGSVVQLAGLPTATPLLAPLAHAHGGSFQLKLQLDRPPAQPAILRGKIWRQYELEPADWMVATEQPLKGPLAAVGLSTLNCACTFTGLKLSFLE